MTYDTNVLNPLLTNPDVLYTSLTSRYTSTFYTAQSTLSSSNFVKSTTLSGQSTTVLGITPVVPLSSYSIVPTVNLSVDQYTSLVTLQPTASANSSTTVYNTSAFFLASAGVTHVELISAGTINGQDVYGIAFNKRTPELTSLSATTTTLSAYSGVKFTVNNAYNGSQMAFILDDRSVYSFTVNTGTANQSLTATTLDTWPELRRLVVLGYL